MILIVMVSRINSCFNVKIKLLKPVVDNGEIIVDFSASDAIKVEFNKFGFVIRMV